MLRDCLWMQAVCGLQCEVLNVPNSASRRRRHQKHVATLAAGRQASLLALRKSDTAQHALGSTVVGFLKGVSLACVLAQHFTAALWQRSGMPLTVMGRVGTGLCACA